MKRILILGTGSAQKDLIQYCKENDFYVIASSNAPGGAGERYADEFCLVDIVNEKEIEKLAKDYKVDFVYSVGSDVAMPTVAGVSKTLGLPCLIDRDTAVICNHKNMLREVLNNKNVKGNIPFQIMESPDEPITVPFPAVMKPSDSQGQRGVRRVDNIDGIKEHFDESMSFSREKKVIIEQYIDGDEISVNTFLKDGELKFYLISDRKIWDEYPGGIIHEHIIPSKYEKDLRISGAIRELVTGVLDATGIKNGPAYFQIKISTEGIPYLIEVTPRLDGCHMWRLIRYSTGIDLLKASMDLLLDKGYTQSGEFEVKPYSLEFLCSEPGTEFNKDNYTVPDHEYLCWYYEDGQKINRMNGYFEKCGYVIKEGKQ